MKAKNLLAAALLLGPIFHANSAGMEDVDWCLYGDADSLIVQQPMREYCPSVLAATVVGNWYGNEQAQWVATLIQRDWVRRGASLACSPSAADKAAAVGLVAACQCHNRGAADWVLGNPEAVLKKLAQYAGC